MKKINNKFLAELAWGVPTCNPCAKLYSHTSIFALTLYNCITIVNPKIYNLKYFFYFFMWKLMNLLIYNPSLHPVNFQHLNFFVMLLVNLVFY